MDFRLPGNFQMRGIDPYKDLQVFGFKTEVLQSKPSVDYGTNKLSWTSEAYTLLSVERF